MFIDILNRLMSDKGINKNILAKESGIPYTTIDGFYKKGSENIKLSTLQKLSEYLNVSLDYLIKGDEYTLTNHEKKLVTAYRNKPEMQASIDKLLDIERDTIQIYRAAESSDNHSDEIKSISLAQLQKLKDAPETDETLL